MRSKLPITKRARYCIWIRWKSCERITSICKDYGLSRRKCKRIIKRYHSSYLNKGYYKKWLDNKLKNISIRESISLDEASELMMKQWNEREQKRIEADRYMY